MALLVPAVWRQMTLAALDALAESQATLARRDEQIKALRDELRRYVRQATTGATE